MTKTNWMETLNWNEEQLDDLRYAGFAYIRQGKYDIALPMFEALVLLNSENAYDAQTLGALYLEMGDTKNAMKILDRALKLEAEHAPTLLNLTKAFFITGRKEEGLKLAEILKNEPDNAISSTARALLLAYS